MIKNYHESVMIGEALEGLLVQKGGKYIDATLGNGGHAIEILRSGGEVLGIDLDPAMIAISKERLGKRATLVNGNFTEIAEIAKENGFGEANGILFDFGVSNVHLKDLERGFSFENPEAPLDMRLNPGRQGVKASDLINVLREDQLRSMFEVVLDSGSAKWISKRIIESRSQDQIIKVGQMLEICSGLRGKKSLDPATLPFLALRIAVNSELDNLRLALPRAFSILVPCGRLVVISFHSGEDSLVKSFFEEKVREGAARLVTFKPKVASERELAANRKARSAKMRILERK